MKLIDATQSELVFELEESPHVMACGGCFTLDEAPGHWTWARKTRDHGSGKVRAIARPYIDPHGG